MRVDVDVDVDVPANQFVEAFGDRAEIRRREVIVRHGRVEFAHSVLVLFAPVVGKVSRQGVAHDAASVVDVFALQGVGQDVQIEEARIVDERRDADLRFVVDLHASWIVVVFV